MMGYDMKNRINSDLSNCLSLSKFEKAQMLLRDNKSDIDVLYKGGIFFDLVISKNNSDMLELLLECAKDNKVDFCKLKEVLIDLTEGSDLSKKMQKVLSPYIDFENSVDSREHDFDDFDLQLLQLPISFENDQNHEITTSGNVEHNHTHTEVII